VNLPGGLPTSVESSPTATIRSDTLDQALAYKDPIVHRGRSNIAISEAASP
jgi:hypothetical protein